jgi:predicted N-acyltransferase
MRYGPNSAMPKPYTAHAAQSIGEIDAAEWDACANPEADTARLGAPPPGPQSQCIKEQTAYEVERYNPFITHAFLKSLETSRSVGPKTGWISAHVLVRDAIGRLAAAAPAYFKTHSMGEYVSIMAGRTPITAQGCAIIPNCKSPCLSRQSPAADSCLRRDMVRRQARL